MEQQFDPYYQWLGIAKQHRPPNHYRLLGLEMLEDNAEVIQNSADRQMGHLRTFQNGQRAAEAQRLLNEIAAAAGELLNAASKQAYDAKFIGGLQQAQVPWATDAGAAQPPPARPAAPAMPAPGLQAAPLAAPAPPAQRPARLDAHPSGDQEPTPVPTPVLGEGTTVGDYQILRTLDASRSGSIFQAKHRASGCDVALKVLLTEGRQAEELAARFARKVRILSSMQHPNLLRVYDSGVHEGRPYLVTEFIAGQNLERLLTKVGPLPVGHAINYTAQAATGLEAAHAAGVYHRNIKPANLMVYNQTGVVKVIGLGLARMNLDWADNSVYEQLTAAGTTMGTADYMAPEQCKDATAVDHRSDIYSLGCTLYKLLTGKVMYAVKGPLRKAMAHTGQPIPPLQNSRDDISEQLDAVFQKMVAKAPADRFQSMAEVMHALKAIA